MNALLFSYIGMYKRILIAIDGSDHASHALNAAIESALKWNAELIILTVIPPLSPFVYSSEINTEHITKLENNLLEYHQRILKIAANTIEQHPQIKFVTRLEKGRPSSVIVDVTNEENVDLIVMGSRGLGGITGWVLGSTSRHVVETCTKPILIVK